VLDCGGTPPEFWTEHLRVQRVRDERRRLREEPSPTTTPFWERAAPDPAEPAEPDVSVLPRVRRQPPARFPAVDPWERLEELGLRVIHGRGAE